MLFTKVYDGSLKNLVLVPVIRFFFCTLANDFQMLFSTPPNRIPINLSSKNAVDDQVLGKRKRSYGLGISSRKFAAGVMERNLYSVLLRTP